MSVLTLIPSVAPSLESSTSGSPLRPSPRRFDPISRSAFPLPVIPWTWSTLLPLRDVSTNRAKPVPSRPLGPVGSRRSCSPERINFIAVRARLRTQAGKIHSKTGYKAGRQAATRYVLHSMMSIYKRGPFPRKGPVSIQTEHKSTASILTGTNSYRINSSIKHPSNACSHQCDQPREEQQRQSNFSRLRDM